MKQVCLLASLLAAAAGNLCASGTVLTCSYTVTGLMPGYSVPAGAISSSPSTPGCFTASFVNTSAWDSLSWGAPQNIVGYGQSGLGNPTPGNSFPITGSGTEVRSVSGDPIEVQEAPDYTGASTTISRETNLALEYSTSKSQWETPGFYGTPSVSAYAGHFNSATTPTGTSDQVVELANGGPLELVFLNEPAFGAFFQISSVGGNNALFEVEIQAFASNNSAIGTYYMTESGTGTGGTCTGLSSKPPVPCNNAPTVGFYDPEGRIRSIYISVFTPGNPNNLLGFEIESLELDPIPEPAAVWMIGAGLAAIAFYGRKRSAGVGSFRLLGRVRRIVSG
jgi:hypothetical protein